MRRLCLILLAVCACLGARAQILSLDGETFNTDSIRQEYNDDPYFGLYKDNYFVFGTAVGPKPTKYNSNVKFQISIAAKLTKSTLPLGTYLYLFYTQKVFWDILRESMPMTDLNFNPGVGLAKPLFVKNRYIGKAFMLIEHESNGRDGDDSRSWNKISFGGNIIIDPSLMVHGKVWIPIVDGKNNKDILKYSGIYQMGMQYLSPHQNFFASLVLTKRKNWKLDYNTTLEAGWRWNPKLNLYLFAQYYNGYGEGMLAYKQWHSQLRVGIVFRPKLFSDY